MNYSCATAPGCTAILNVLIRGGVRSDRALKLEDVLPLATRVSCPLLTLSRHRPFQTDRLSRYDACRYGTRADMRRREFISLVGGAVAMPYAAQAQQPTRMRRVGVLMTLTKDNVEGQARLNSLSQGLEALGLDPRPEPAHRRPLAR